MPGGSFVTPNDPLAQLGQQLAELQRAVRDLQTPKPSIIPVLSADPPDTDSSNYWYLPDGRVRIRVRNTADTAWVYREIITTTPGSSSSATAPAPPKPAPKTYETTWSASLMEDYKGDNTKRLDFSDRLYYGNGDTYNDRNKSLLIFPSAVATALASSQIVSIRLNIFSEHTWSNSGSDVYLSVHNQSTIPTTFSGTSAPNGKRYVTRIHLRKNTQERISIPIVFAQAIRDGWGKGIVLEALNDSKEQYGYVAGSGSGKPVPSITVRYVK